MLVVSAWNITNQCALASHPEKAHIFGSPVRLQSGKLSEA